MEERAKLEERAKNEGWIVLPRPDSLKRLKDQLNKLTGQAADISHSRTAGRGST